MNVTEYLEHLFAIGVREESLPVVQPLFQKRIWDRFKPGEGPKKLAKVIDERKEDSRFHVEGRSWTNNISWVKSYDALLGPMERVSSLFYEKALKPGVATNEYRYRNALFHLLTVSDQLLPLLGARAVRGLRARDLSACRRDPEP